MTCLLQKQKEPKEKGLVSVPGVTNIDMTKSNNLPNKKYQKSSKKDRSIGINLHRQGENILQTTYWTKIFDFLLPPQNISFRMF
jgi:hypothetical protein